MSDSQKLKEAAEGGLRTTGLFGLDGCPLHRKTPFGMTNVSMTQLSIARHYGGIKYNGDEYTYLPKTDELIRNDVLKWQTKNAKKSLPNVKVMATPLAGASMETGGDA